MVISTICDFLRTHLGKYMPFIFGVQTHSFWVKLANALEACQINVDIIFTSISLGIFNIKKHKIPDNYIIVLAKYCIFKCKCQQEITMLTTLKNHFKETINIEKRIAYMKGKVELHNAHWNQCLQQLEVALYILAFYLLFLSLVFLFIKNVLSFVIVPGKLVKKRNHEIMYKYNSFVKLYCLFDCICYIMYFAL